MAKTTTIIDIGSNSMRMVVLKKSSRFGFHLINETKSRVKISEGSYKNSGNLADIPMQRAFEALKSFLTIAKNLQSRKILCVATSALRDAPNKKVFVNRVKKELGLAIKIIDGKKEAYYGGVAALNLLHIDNFVTVDIGGGSTELCLVRDGTIVKTVSLDIGTVRMRELFFTNGNKTEAKEFIQNTLQEIDFTQSKVVALGGTARALSKALIQDDKYPLDVLHGFSYNVESNKTLYENILNAQSEKELKQLGIKKDRFDTIQEGTFIFQNILSHLGAKEVVTSGVGVREGVYLCDILRNTNHKFPANFNVSVRSLLDRFALCERQTGYHGNNAAKIFEVLSSLHQLDSSYKRILVIASKLHSIGVTLNFYNFSENAFNFILNGLSYGFSHQERVLIAHIIKYSKKSIPKPSDLVEYETLLPDSDTVGWLSFMISLNLRINSDYGKHQVAYTLQGKKLTIKCSQSLYLAKTTLDKLQSPVELEIDIQDNIKG